MAGISFLGSYSGIDRSTIDQLIKAESMPLVRMKNEKDSLVKQQSVWKDVNTRLTNLFDKIKKLQDVKSFTSKAGVSSNEDIVSMTASDKAVSGEYKISVERLASNTSIIGGQVKTDGKVTDKLDFEGSFTIKNQDGESVKIDVSKDDSLKDIVDRINDGTKDSKDEDGNSIKGTGIKASIIDNHIVLSDNKTGDRTIELEGDSGDILNNLGLDNVKEEKGTTAKFNINGIDVERDTNNVDDVVDGVTIKLKKTHEEGKFDTVKVDIDYDKTEKAIKDFVDQYNSTMSFIEENIKAGDPEIKGSKGDLYGDSGLKRLHDELRKMVTDPISRKDGDIKDISEIGISTTDKTGSLKLDSEALKKALKEDSSKVLDFFYKKTESGQEEGLTSKLNEKIDIFISKKNGIIKNKNESFDRVLKDLNVRMEDFSARMDKKEAYYIKKFSELDQVMMNAESQMAWLQSQVVGMNN